MTTSSFKPSNGHTKLSNSQETYHNGSDKKNESKTGYQRQLLWHHIIVFIILHCLLVNSFYLIYKEKPWLTLSYTMIVLYMSGIGVTAGTHRLWAHKSYKARKPLEILLMLMQTLAGQKTIYHWCRDHRLHHKFSETDADPHNIKRGFFFAHMGWLCCKKHPDVLEKGKLIDMSDLKANPIVMFQYKYYFILSLTFNFILPVAIPCLLWQEKLFTSFSLVFILRYMTALHGTWLVNSAAHSIGYKPYDDRIEACESIAANFYGLGEGFHNYHHTFPYDYSTSEHGKYMNITTAFIDFFASLGLAYDLRKVDKKSIESRKLRTGMHSNITANGKLREDEYECWSLMFKSDQESVNLQHLSFSLVRGSIHLLTSNFQGHESIKWSIRGRSCETSKVSWRLAPKC